MTTHCLFGPVQSRRLGTSLGINLLPYKTCAFDCVYCECGATTVFTLERSEFVPLPAVIAEIESRLSRNPALDYITFSGSGEPTLYSRLGELIAFLKQTYPQYKVALLTNSTLLTGAEVRNEIKSVDLCVPSLDSATEAGLQRIDRPGAGLPITAADLSEGIKQTKAVLKGAMWLEIFIVPGINDTPEELAALSRAIRYIAPDKVQLNTLDRAGSEPWVKKPAPDEIKEIVRQLQIEDVEIIL